MLGGSRSKTFLVENMFKVVYTHDGTNVYDLFFLEHLTGKHIVHFLTFNSDPRFVPANAIVIKMPEPLTLSAIKADMIEGIRMYFFCFLRALILRLYLKQIRPSIVLGNMATKYGFYSALSGFKPFILIIWGSDILVAPKRFFLFRCIAKFSLKKADAVIVDSDVQEKAAVELGCDPRKILKFPWFDLESVNVEFSRDEIRKQLGWASNPIVICVRKHEPIYGVEYLIEAIPPVIKKIPESRFLIIGKGQLSEKLMRRVRDLRMEKYVKFVGEVERKDLLLYLNAADVYVSPSLSDGTSASLLEAMALGIPPVVTEIAGNVEWIKNGWSGILVPAKNSQQLAEKMALLINNQRLRRQISQNALKTVKAKVNWRKHSKTFDNLILTLVQKSKKYGRR